MDRASESSPVATDAFPDYRVRARNLLRGSANKIHDDDVARAHGYAAGLVAGTTIYGYLTHPLVTAWGLAWLGRGTARLSLIRPVYHDDPVTVSARLVGRSGSEVAGEMVVAVTAATRRQPAATLLAGLAWGGPPLGPDPEGYAAAPLPSTRAPATAQALGALDRLGAPVLVLDEPEVAGYADAVDDRQAAYRGDGALAHPGLLLQQANRALSENVALGPWVHVASDVVHCGPARVGDRLTTRGRPARLFERRGHAFVELDLLIVANDTRPVAWVRHTAIYRLREPAG